MILLCIKLIICPALFYIALAAPLEDKVSVESPPDKVLLTEVQTITLHKDWCTAARRIPAIPQLKCQGGSANGDCNSRAVNVAQCYNKAGMVTAFSGNAMLKWELTTSSEK
uniref:Store-operated calcium entry-associated regulatory factor n=1 Tax=Ditylenchus dipsaci TaxID=166011 RepID=A0A915DRS8_9BILA